MHEDTVIELATRVAMKIAHRFHRTTHEELLGPAWEGASRGAKKVDPGRTEAHQRSYIAKSAWNSVMNYMNREVRESASRDTPASPRNLGEDDDGITAKNSDPGTPGDTFALLQRGLDEANVLDPDDRRAALAEWAGGNPPEEARAITERRLRKIRGKLRGVL